MRPVSTARRFDDVRGSVPGPTRAVRNGRPGFLIRIRGLLVTCVAVTLLATGCPDDAAEETDDGAPPMAGVVVTLLVPRELGLSDHWGISITEAEAETGAICELREYEPDLAFTEGLELTGDAALVVCPLNVVPELHGTSGLAPIPDDVSGGWQEVFDALRNGVGSPGGQPSVVPLSAPPLICFYRADLLDQAGLSPPSTWAEYRQLVATADDWAAGHAVVEPWGEEFRATMFLQRAAGYALHPDNFSFTFDVSSGEPLIDQPPFVRALSEIQLDLTHLDPASLSMGPGECFRQIAQGHAALAIGMLPEPGEGGGGGGGGPVEFTAVDGAVRIGIQPLPGASDVFHSREQTWHAVETGKANAVTVLGGDAWVICVAGNGDPVSEGNAWRLWNTIDALELESSRPGGAFQTGCRPSDVAARRGGGAGLSADLRQQYLAAVTDSLRSGRVVAELPVPGHQQFRDLLTSCLTDALEEGRDPEESLNELAGDWRALSNELGASSVLNTYRWCLGLSPLPAD